MRSPIVAGNWKMNGSKDSNSGLLSPILSSIDNLLSVEMLVLPPFVFLGESQTALEESDVSLGAQNVSAEVKGAFTGEISASMLKEFGCEYVLVGHSERRALFGETNAQVANKFRAAKAAGLTPILCVGETLAERKQGRMKEIVLAQLQAVIEVNGGAAFDNAVLAYEPVWAIGTGETATPDQAQEVHQFLREQVATCNQSDAKELRILYGGSVKPDNAAALFAMPDIDGGLIGGASLKAQDFLAICQAADAQAEEEC
jgi:triosephosphate isomerase